jgi:hypothetical protein
MSFIEKKNFAPRRRVISWAPSGWLQTGTLGSTGTSFSMVSCPDDFFAVRLGFANILPEPYQVYAIGAASNTSADMINPTGSASWVPFTFANGGADSERIATSSDAPGDIVVQGNTIDPNSGEAAIPRWSWTDWIPLASVARVDIVGGPRILMVRVLHPVGTTITQTNGQFIGYTGVPKLNKDFDYGMGWADGDHVTIPHPVFHGIASPGNSDTRAPETRIRAATAPAISYLRHGRQGDRRSRPTAVAVWASGRYAGASGGPGDSHFEFP